MWGLIQLYPLTTVEVQIAVDVVYILSAETTQAKLPSNVFLTVKISQNVKDTSLQIEFSCTKRVNSFFLHLPTPRYPINPARVCSAWLVQPPSCSCSIIHRTLGHNQIASVNWSTDSITINLKSSFLLNTKSIHLLFFILLLLVLPRETLSITATSGHIGSENQYNWLGRRHYKHLLFFSLNRTSLVWVSFDSFRTNSSPHH